MLNTPSGPTRLCLTGDEVKLTAVGRKTDSKNALQSPLGKSSKLQKTGICRGWMDLWLQAKDESDSQCTSQTNTAIQTEGSSLLWELRGWQPWRVRYVRERTAGGEPYRLAFPQLPLSAVEIKVNIEALHKLRDGILVRVRLLLRGKGKRNVNPAVIWQRVQHAVFLWRLGSK